MSASPGGAPLLEVHNLRVTLHTPRGPADALRGISFSLARGQTLGLIGESGCGKSITALALMGLLPERAVVTGSLRFEGRELVGLPEHDWCRLRGNRMAMIFQEPMTALNPLHTIGRQIAESLRLHKGLDSRAARAEALRLLERVQLPQAAARLDAYPHQLSGGQRQRVVIAIALACGPDLLIADEPTTALDVTIQAQILDLLAREQRRRHMAMILITHDLGVVAGRTDEVAVMYAGRVVERAPTPALFKKMRMPYTEALLAALPKIDAAPHTPLPAISGRPPDPTRPLQGCSFSPRCRYAVGQCHTEKPGLAEAESPDHLYACFHPIKTRAGAGA